jgi:hypothetical protein
MKSFTKLFLLILINNGNTFALKVILPLKNLSSNLPIMFKTILPCLWPQFQEPTDVCQNAAQPLITFTGSGGTAPIHLLYY